MTITQVLNLSISASWLVLAVVLIRLALKKAPKAFHCALWALVAFRLLCPVSFESELSLIPSREVIPQEYLYMEPAEQDTPAKLARRYGSHGDLCAVQLSESAAAGAHGGLGQGEHL